MGLIRLKRSEWFDVEIDESDGNSRMYKNIRVRCPCSVPVKERNRYVEEGVIKYGSSLEFVEIVHDDDDKRKINIQYGLRICAERFIGGRKERMIAKLPFDIRGG